MSLAEGGPLALAGIYELWRRRPAQGGAEGGVEGAVGGAPDADPWLVTFAVLTRDAEPGLQVVHDRMPVVLPQDAWEEWLDPATTAPDEVGAQLQAACSIAPGRFTAVPVGSRVGRVREDDAALVTPVGPPLPL